MDPLFKIASKSVNSSRPQLKGLMSDKGAHVKEVFLIGIMSKAIRQLCLSAGPFPAAGAAGDARP